MLNGFESLQEIWGIFGPFISTHFGTVSPLSMFSIDQPLFLQKTKPLYTIPKYLFGIGIWILVRKELGEYPFSVCSPWALLNQSANIFLYKRYSLFFFLCHLLNPKIPPKFDWLFGKSFLREVLFRNKVVVELLF